MKIYISNLRILATFAVIVIHTAANFVTKYNHIPLATWQTANVIDAFARFCVPLFVMISGALLLGKESDFKTFTIKRTQRIIYPFLLWSVVYAFRKASSYFEFKHSALKIAEDTFSLIIGGASYHFWYTFMIIGLYLFIPILNAWIKSASNKELHYFLAIWAVTLLYNEYSKTFLPPFDLLYFSKYIGYLVLGYYLDRNFDTSKKNIYFSILLIAIGTLATCLLTAHFSKISRQFVATFYGYTTLNVALTTIGIFTLFKAIAHKSNSLLNLLDKNSFGIYFIHVLVLEKIRGFIPFHHYHQSPVKAIAYIVMVSLLCYAFSLSIIFLLRQIKPLTKWVG